MSNPASRARTPELRAMKAYVAQAADHGHTAEMIDVSDFQRLPEFQAMFLRLDTSVLGFSWAASRYAWALGLRVVDDPRSILTCMNKAHVQGLLEQHGIPTPETILLTRAGREELDTEGIFGELGQPVVCKAPSGAFSSAVALARDARELRATIRRFAQQSDVVLLQRFTPSRFDWRVGILCGRPLYAAKYHFPKGAWRIHDTPEGQDRRRWGKTERIALDEVPQEVLDHAMAAAGTIGHGLYGVDLKTLDDGRVVVIEVNDNPNIDWGGELPVNSPVFGEILDLVATHGPQA